MNKFRIIFFSANIFIGTFFLTNNVSAQQASRHEVKKGETLSMIARENGTTVGDIMRFNGMNTNSKLEVGQTIKIPPAGVHIIGPAAENVEKETTTPSPSGDNTATSHTVVAGESLYKISKKYNVSVNNLRKWNNLTSDNIKVGQVLQLSDSPIATIPTENTSTTSSGMDETSSTDSNSGTSGVIMANTKPKKSDKNDSVKVISTETTTLSSGSGGYFAKSFGQDVDNQTLAVVTGKAKAFKSQSGWSDQKYYIMMNDVTPGSIVKVSYNGTSVFAKVLWNLIDTKENNGLSFRLSDATIPALGITGDTFDLKVDYYK